MGRQKTHANLIFQVTKEHAIKIAKLLKRKRAANKPVSIDLDIGDFPGQTALGFDDGLAAYDFGQQLLEAARRTQTLVAIYLGPPRSKAIREIIERESGSNIAYIWLHF
jgi:hypothetical protein